MKIIIVLFIICWLFFALFKYFARQLKRIDDRLDELKNMFADEPEINIQKEALLLSNKYIKDFKKRVGPESEE